jgi:putative drug exporter of the RND superfamily
VHTTLPIPAYVPMLVFAIVFGLSMDYEVFLLSRVHEAWIETGDPHRAVAVGIGATARVITTAAAIMVVVFASFVLSTDPTVKMLAIGMAFAVLIDASLVRMILVPSVMALLDARAWWMPRWLEPIVPHLDLEEGAAEPASAAEEPASRPAAEAPGNAAAGDGAKAPANAATADAAKIPAGAATEAAPEHEPPPPGGPAAPVRDAAGSEPGS